MAMYNERMRPEIKARWVARLRDPNEKQITNTLEVFDARLNVVGRCCLGVLSDEVKNEVPSVYVSLRPVSSTSTLSTRAYDGNTSTLCTRVQKYCGIKSQKGNFYINDNAGKWQVTLNLALLNDNGFSFAQIADIVDYFF